MAATRSGFANVDVLFVAKRLLFIDTDSAKMATTYHAWSEGDASISAERTADEDVNAPVRARATRGISSRANWESLLKLVKCEIISFKKNDQLDSYVLSESSMFVSKRCFILKTCGSTTLLKAVKPLLFVVQELTGFDEVLDIFYSRKNFMRPELQDKPHTSFEDEVEVLDELFDVLVGAFISSQRFHCKFFVRSLKTGYYFTIHITPEPHCSYVSFETNAPQDNYHDLVTTLLKMFLPGKFVMTLFANQLSVAAKGMKESCNTEFRSYNRKELQVCRFNAYDLTYALFAKAPS
ncbi:hypothetical protein HPB48_010456 [Haemaphysalis longicornis]|uniref:Adenosylmethionine decarboxylase n=1 Tax=Haemaphysalis longicornis TaxID=44386 RepID=A0A9J6H528_HAELO|nr:hypothetical protein HPB48_010456 [Haemaphysalis longicornis]